MTLAKVIGPKVTRSLTKKREAFETSQIQEKNKLNRTKLWYVIRLCLHTSELLQSFKREWYARAYSKSPLNRNS